MGATFFVILGLAIWIGLAFWPAIMAKNKGYSFLLFLVLSWFVSFVLTLIIVLVLPDKTETAQDKADIKAAEAALKRDEHRAK